MCDVSMFGYKSDNPAMRMAYDMMVLDQIDKDTKEMALRDMSRSAAALDELLEDEGVDFFGD